MEYREKILALAQTGPLLPSGVAKALATNSIMAGAMLSEMCSKGLLKTSALRVGGSPLYLIPGKEEQLLNYLQSLNEKDRRTVEKLQAEKLIRNSEADPLTQVSLVQVKDFAKPLTVTYENKQETFWKWFAISDKEAEELIREKLEGKEQKKPEQEQKKLTETPTEPTETKPEKPQKPKPAPAGDFWQQIQDFLKKNSITLTEQTTIKKKLEFDLIVELPSPVGKLTYYCKARNKKKITDADISAAYVQGQIKKLPVIYLTNGEPDKKAKEVLAQLKGITVTKV